MLKDQRELIAKADGTASSSWTPAGTITSSASISATLMESSRRGSHRNTFTKTLLFIALPLTKRIRSIIKFSANAFSKSRVGKNLKIVRTLFLTIK